MFKINFNLKTFSGNLEASHEVIKAPDYVRIIRNSKNDFSRGNLIDYTESYIAIAEKPFELTIQEKVTHGNRNGNEYTLKAEEVEIVKNYFDDSFWDDAVDGAVDGIDWHGLAKELNIELDDQSSVGFNNPIAFTSEPGRKDYLFFRKLKDNKKCLMVTGEGDVDIVNVDDYDIYFP